MRARDDCKNTTTIVANLNTMQRLTLYVMENFVQRCGNH